jgi:hypothetical protein
MTPPFDIFQKEADGSVLWCESAATLEEAKARARELAVGSPGEYFIFSRRTGNRLQIEPDAAGGEAQSASS